MAASYLRRILDALRRSPRRDRGELAGAGSSARAEARHDLEETTTGGTAPEGGERGRRRLGLEHTYGDGDVPVSVRILSAVLLHRGGHRADAWVAFEELLADPQLGSSGAGRARLLGEIFARMQTCLEQEGRFDAALTPAILAYAVRAQTYALEGQQAQLDESRSAAQFERQIGPLAQQAELGYLMPAMRALTDAHLGSLPALDVEALRSTLGRFVRARPTLMSAQSASDVSPG